MIEPRPQVLDLHRDVERGTKRVEYVRLDRNEMVTPLPDALRRAVFDSLHPAVLNAYPDPSPLYERLSKKLGVPEDRLFVTSGSDTAIRRIFEAFVRPGDAVLQADPSYAMYRVYTAMFEGRAVTVPYDENREISIEAFMQRLKERPRVMFLANPDQPTGTALTPDVLKRLATEARANDVLMVIDEAYHPFHPLSALEWSAAYDNVVVTRTFSKVGGLAGLRIGYLVGAPQVVEWIQRMRGSHEVNGVAIAIACWELEQSEIEHAHVAAIEAGRALLCEAAGKLGLTCLPCHTNFQLMRFPDGTNLQGIVDTLKKEGFLIKGPFGSPSLRGCLRVSLAGPDVLGPFTEVLKRVCHHYGIS